MNLEELILNLDIDISNNKTIYDTHIHMLKYQITNLKNDYKNYHDTQLLSTNTRCDNNIYNELEQRYHSIYNEYIKKIHTKYCTKCHINEIPSNKKICKDCNKNIIPIKSTEEKFTEYFNNLISTTKYTKEKDLKKINIAVEEFRKQGFNNIKRPYLYQLENILRINNLHKYYNIIIYIWNLYQNKYFPDSPLLITLQKNEIDIIINNISHLSKVCDEFCYKSGRKNIPYLNILYLFIHNQMHMYPNAILFSQYLKISNNQKLNKKNNIWIILEQIISDYGNWNK